MIIYDDNKIGQKGFFYVIYLWNTLYANKL